MFGAGGGTSSYREAEETDLFLLWGSNARETHPIFFHHLLKGVRRGARLVTVDPRRTSSAEWADLWLGLDVGSDIALANAMAREIIHAGLANEEFIGRATSGFDDYRRTVEPYTLEYAERETGVPAAAIREAAHAYAKADRAMICWTLGITEHHNAVDNVLALISLSLLTGHVGRYGSGLNPLRGQNNVQGGGDMGALPDRLPGFQHVENDALRDNCEQIWQRRVPPKRGKHLSGMFEAMDRGELTSLYVLGENPLQSEADRHLTERRLMGLDLLVVQDIFLTATAEIADVVLPAAAAWAESEGTVTNSERRVQRVRKALEPPGEARDDLWILFELARRLGHDWGEASAEKVWDEVRAISPVHRGMTYARLEAELAASSGRATTRPTRASCSSTRGCGSTRCPATARRSCPWSTTRRSTSCPTSSRCGSPPAGGWTRTTPASSRAATTTRGASARRWTCRRRTSSGWASSKVSACGSSRGAARSRRRSAWIRAPARASRS